MKKGTIVVVDFGNNGMGSEYRGCRPCVVYSNSKHLQYAKTLQVIPLTSKTKNNLPVHYILNKTKYSFLWEQYSTTMCESITTISKNRIKEVLGEIDKNDLSKIDECVKIQLSL
ncbi:MAG: type II toxin-antitoxin system PemK/MazF family toxin [Bacteroidales bacterium]